MHIYGAILLPYLTFGIIELGIVIFNKNEVINNAIFKRFVGRV